jgi:hypothetical protein
MGSHSNAIHAYIRAKDENRPHLMPSAFASDASLEIGLKLKTSLSHPRQKASKKLQKSS